MYSTNVSKNISICLFDYREYSTNVSFGDKTLFLRYKVSFCFFSFLSFPFPSALSCCYEQRRHYLCYGGLLLPRRRRSTSEGKKEEKKSRWEVERAVVLEEEFRSDASDLEFVGEGIHTRSLVVPAGGTVGRPFAEQQQQ